MVEWQILATAALALCRVPYQDSLKSVREPTLVDRAPAAVTTDDKLPELVLAH
jgi:hypothetical protein